MGSTQVEDELSAVRESFYVGYYKKTLAALEQTFSANEMVEAEKESLAARCRLAMASKLSADEISPAGGSPGLKTLSLLLAFRHAESASERKDAAEAMKRLADTSQDASAKQLAAGALLEMGDHNEALRLLSADTTEMLAAKAQVVLSIDRPDLAERLGAQLAAINDDSALTKLVSAWNHLASGNYQEAYLTFTDLQTLLGGERHGETQHHSAMILDGMAIANMQRRLWTEALEDLQRSYAGNASGDTSADTLATLVACYRQSRKNEEADQTFQKLKLAAPKHHLVVASEELDAALEQFQKLGAQTCRS